MSQKPSREATAKLAGLIADLNNKFDEIKAHADANGLSVVLDCPAGPTLYYNGEGSEDRETNIAEAEKWGGSDADIYKGWYSSSDLC